MPTCLDSFEERKVIWTDTILHNIKMVSYKIFQDYKERYLLYSQYCTSLGKQKIKSI